MRKRGVISIFVIVTMVFAAFPSFALDFLYTTSTNGALENCRCPHDPNGAMEKIVSEVKRRRAVGEVLLFDSGDFSPPRVDSLLATAALDIHAIAGYDAVTIGDQEIMQGQEFLREAGKRLPVVAANLKIDNEKVFKDALTFKCDGQTIFVVGIIHPDALRFLDQNLVSGIQLSDPEAALNEVLTKKPEGAIGVLLSHAALEWNKTLADRVEGIDLIIGGHSQDLLKRPFQREGAGVVQAGGSARHLGVVQVKRGRVRGELIEMKRTLPDDSDVISRVITYRKQLRK